MPYKVLSPDTHPKVEKVMFEHLRRMGRRERLERGVGRVDASLCAMWAAMRRTHPLLSDDELHVEWVRVQFGEELAERVKEWLQSRSGSTKVTSVAP